MRHESASDTFTGDIAVTGRIKSTTTTGSTSRTKSPGAMVRKTDAPTIANSAYTVVNFSGHWSANNMDTTVWDTGQPSRFYAPVTGRYSICGGVVFASNATGWRIVHLRVNSAGSSASGVSLIYFTSNAISGNPTCVSFNLSDIYLVAGDYIECFANQNSGGVLGIGSFFGMTTTFCMNYIGPV